MYILIYYWCKKCRLFSHVKKNCFVNVCFLFFIYWWFFCFVSLRFVSFLLYHVLYLLWLVSFRFASFRKKIIRISYEKAYHFPVSCVLCKFLRFIEKNRYQISSPGSGGQQSHLMVFNTWKLTPWSNLRVAHETTQSTTLDIYWCSQIKDYNGNTRTTGQRSWTVLHSHLSYWWTVILSN
jgi:hypothetical protein